MTPITVRTATVLLSLATTLTLGGCAMTTPPDPAPQKTGQQLRTQIIADTVAAIAASGIPDGWTLGPQPGARAWDPDAKEFIGATCSTMADGTRTQRFDVNLYHAPVGDPVAFANMMGDYWRDQGYIVSTVIPTITSPGGNHYTQIRADRADGTLAAGVVGQDKLFVLKSYSECSTDPTLEMFAGPTGYRVFDTLERTPYHPTHSPTITPYPEP
ncbi:hypothetical protein GCM10027406_27140 [Leifsonia lichenia]